MSSQGLLKAIGLSLNRWEPSNGIGAVKTRLIDSVQVIYNIFDQNPEDELFPTCRTDSLRSHRECSRRVITRSLQGTGVAVSRFD
jgi:aryl-alcohol dehydrogenase-like predicted oxidoreductase